MHYVRAADAHCVQLRTMLQQWDSILQIWASLLSHAVGVSVSGNRLCNNC